MEVTALRFKSWVPEYVDGANPVVIAGVDFRPALRGGRPRPARALCIDPDDWLIVSRDVDHAATVQVRIAHDLAQHGLDLIDVSDELAAIELRGSLAREVLAKGCEPDASAGNLPVGRCARMRLANVEVVIDCVAAGPCFELYCARSHSARLHSWLIDAAAELESANAIRTYSCLGGRQ